MSAPDVITVRDLARGDGVADDAPAFKTAITAASNASGGVVFVDVGTYKFNSNVNIPANVWIEAAPGVSFTGSGVFTNSATKGQIINYSGGAITIGTDAMLAAPNDYYAPLALRQTFTGAENADSIQLISAQARYTAGGGEAIDCTSSTATGGAGPWAGNIQAVGVAAGHQAAGTLTWARGVGVFVYCTVGGGTITNAAAFYAYDATVGQGGVITNQYGMFIEAPTKGTNKIGLYVGGGATQAVWVASGNTLVATLQIGSLGAFASGDKYLIVDGSGNVHKSGLGPAS